MIPVIIGRIKEFKMVEIIFVPPYKCNCFNEIIT